MKEDRSKLFSIIVSSSDGYSDCWDPFFTLLKVYFPGIEKIEILLSTQTKDYSNPVFNLKVVKHGPKAAWSQRLRQTLEQVSSEIILFLDEDSFLRSIVDVKLLDKLIELMLEHEKISHIRLLRGDWIGEKTEFPQIDELKVGTKKRFMLHAGFWKKEVLIKHLEDHESTWEVEKWGTIRSNILKYKFYCISHDIVDKKISPVNTSANGGIYKGRWIESFVVPLFRENKIEMDFSKRGFYNEKVRFLSRLMIRVDPFLHPFKTYKSIRSILLLKHSHHSGADKNNFSI